MVCKYCGLTIPVEDLLKQNSNAQEIKKKLIAEKYLEEDNFSWVDNREMEIKVVLLECYSGDGSISFTVVRYSLEK